MCAGDMKYGERALVFMRWDRGVDDADIVHYAVYRLDSIWLNPAHVLDSSLRLICFTGFFCVVSV